MPSTLSGTIRAMRAVIRPPWLVHLNGFGVRHIWGGGGGEFVVWLDGVALLLSAILRKRTEMSRE